ncbi:MAG TPA: hypothetical protein VFH68_18900 [Polyangia bacterium]|nr:hypothetical protein [Polyangia bacterium]
MAVEDGSIVGFAPCHREIAVDGLPENRRKHLPPYPLPVLRLARVAAHEQARARGVGATLLRAVFTLALQMADDFGCVGVVVGSIPLETRAGHVGDRPEQLPMFLELGAVPRSGG